MVAKRKKHDQRGPATPAAKPKASIKDIRFPGWAYALCLAGVLAIVAFVRFSHLSYDPPTDIFWSQDLWTDPPQYTSYARNAVLFGDSNPLNENMYLPFRRNSMGALAYLVFLVAGAGFWQSNLAAVLFNLATIIVLSLAITRLKNRTAGILAALLLGTNYIFLTYGRVPFLENAMNFWLALAIYFAARGMARPRWALLAGLALGLGAFFGKMIALHAFPVFLIFAAFIVWLDASRNKTTRWYMPVVYLAAGIVIVAAFWYPLVYLQIEGSYFAEKSTGVYGAPEGLKSISGFFHRVFSLGSDTRLFVRLPVMAIFGFIGVALAFLRFGSSGTFAERLRRVKPEYLLLGLWFWAAYFALMPWNYRPLRYETVLLIPLAGAAAMVLGDLLRRGKPGGDQPAKVSVAWSTVLGMLFFALPVYHLLTARLGTPPNGAADVTGAVLAVVIAAAGAFIVGAGWNKISAGWQHIRTGTRLPEIIVAAVIIVTLVVQGPMFRNWWAHGQRATLSASRDLEQVLGPDAVLVGSYATGLTLENHLKNIVYMFGVANVNYTLFDDYPITHLAVIDDNKKGRAFTDYEVIAGRSRRVTSYVIGNRPVGIFRVAGYSNNPQARKYRPTAYEDAMRCYDLFKEDSMLIYIDQFARENPDNFSLSRFRGLYFMRDSTFDSASYYFEQAVAAYPDDYAVQYNLGHCAMMSFEQNGNAADFEKARKHFAEVLRLRPNDPALRARLEPIIKR